MYDEFGVKVKIFNQALTLSILTQVCCDWREIALIMRDRVFGEHEEQLIDIHDVKVNHF